MAPGAIRQDVSGLFAPHVRGRLEVRWDHTASAYVFTLTSEEGDIPFAIEQAEILAAGGSEQMFFERIAQAVENKSGGDTPAPTVDRAARLHLNAKAATALDAAVPTGLTGRVKQALERSGDVLLVGLSAAGKTTAALQACVELRAQSGLEFAIVDQAFGPPPMAAIVRFLLERSRSGNEKRIIIADNIQARIDSIPVWRTLRSIMAPGDVLAMISWPTLRAEIEEAFPTIETLTVQGETVLNDILARRVDAGQAVVGIESLASGDVFIGRLALDFLDRVGRSPTEKHLLESLLQSIGVAALPADQIACLHTLCCINAIDVPAYATFLSARHSRSVVSALEKRGLIRREGEKLRIGHKSRADLLRIGLKALLDAEGRSPATWREVVLDYLRSLERGDLFAVMQTIDSTRSIEHPELAAAGTYSGLLNSINKLLFRLERAHELDERWGDNIASAIFASLPLAWGAPEHNQAIVDIIRARVACDGAALSFPTGRGREWEDFGKISETMAEFDRLIGRLPEDWEPAQSVDLERFHANWMLGLVLCSEGVATKVDPVRRRRLIRYAGRQLLACGGFYPLRVPWVTARILLGLSLCGETVETSLTARTAAAWLLAQDRGMHEAPPEGWSSGTGAWNSPEQCTAMCALALRGVGVPRSSIFTPATIARLPQLLAKFSAEKDEIDLLLIIECLAEFEALDQHARACLGRLSRKYTSEDGHIAASIDPAEVAEESSKDPFVVMSMMNIMWDMISSSLSEYVDLISTNVDWIGSSTVVENRRELVGKLTALRDKLEDVLGGKRDAVRRNALMGRGNAPAVLVSAVQEAEAALGEVSEMLILVEAADADEIAAMSSKAEAMDQKYV